MAVYLIETSNGKRLVEARTQKSAINFVLSQEAKATTLNTSDLVKHIQEGMTVESVPANEPSETE